MITKRRKLMFYNAMIHSKLIYGLHTLVITDAMASKLNAFQLKGFRQIMKIKTTFVERSNTNEYVYRQVEQELSKNKNSRKIQVRPVTNDIENAAIKLLGEIIRLPDQDPLRRVTFREATAEPLLPAIRRVGRPRGHWAMKTMENAWKTNELWKQDIRFIDGNVRFDAEDVAHQQIIYQAAVTHIF